MERNVWLFYSDLAIVYNNKRHGVFKLGSRTYEFRRVPYFPTKVTEEFLLVDLVNNLDTLAEDAQSLLRLVKHKAKSMDPSKLKRAAHKFGKVRANKFFDQMLSNNKPIDYDATILNLEID